VHGGPDPVLTIALALTAGVLAQALARHLRLPGIVLLLATGVALGPDLLGWIRPGSLGPALGAVTGFAVAVILFDGGLNLDRRRLRGQARTIYLLLSVGVVVTALGAALASRLLLGWSWRLAALFGSLVTVTGPTVITPLLRRVRVRGNLATILEAEGVLVDAIGAVLAVVTLEIVLQPSGAALAHGAVEAPVRLAAGLLAGGVGGAVLALLLRRRRLVPDDYQNILSLAWAVLVYQLGNVLVPESGIMAAIVAGAVVGNAHPHGERELKEFKEQLTTLVIGLLFILLAADVRVAEVTGLGRRGLAVAGALMLVVRPLSIALCTIGSGLRARERLFLAWMAPRGIVAAAVASLFHQQLAAAGDPGGGELRAMVFLVIAATVVFQGATAAPVAGLLGVRRPSDDGYVILGAHPLARLVARLLQQGGHAVQLVDNNGHWINQGVEEGLPAVTGNGLEERTLLRARVDTRRGAIGLTTNESVNLLFARKCRQEYKVPHVYAVLQRANASLDAAMAGAEDVHVLGGVEIDLELWSVRVRRGRATASVWRRATDGGEPPLITEQWTSRLVPLVWRLGRRCGPVDETTRPVGELLVWWMIADEHADEARRWLADRGWEPVPVDTVEGE